MWKCLKFNETKSPDFNYPILVGEVIERVGIDTIGPLITSDNGNKYILVAIDYLTKYVFLKAVTNKTAETVAQFIFEKLFLNMVAHQLSWRITGKNITTN